MDSTNKLNVNITSFSYKRGIPYDPTGNGGGFVIDCRGILNPGRYERYQYLNGKDDDVIDFFLKNTQIEYFLDQTLKMIEVNVKNYIERGFDNLMINFGCTGGQHRSVYCAEWMAEELKAKYEVTVNLNHMELR